MVHFARADIAAACGYASRTERPSTEFADVTGTYTFLLPSPRWRNVLYLPPTAGTTQVTLTEARYCQLAGIRCEFFLLSIDSAFRELAVQMAALSDGMVVACYENEPVEAQVAWDQLGTFASTLRSKVSDTALDPVMLDTRQ